ncbi:hypothetical protein RvY_07310 [Ramazzottius varieornatus]|uniref:Uncharacterized protein n=1 Tax=Ramazzottius varieornatus TaxID=947166 RepID=A0A1D1V1P2_RAMVA|nr:hypothetical protein RvY_07310 [Ramazzottius varieornatus]
MASSNSLALSLIVLTSLIAFSAGTVRYYGAYLSYATGDTFITTYQLHGGSILAHRKWLVECLDGEAVIGIG